MAKDPAVLFYYSDFLVGTEFMSNEEVGIYIRLLCHQADKGRLTEKQVKSVCKAYAIPEFVKDKFTLDENGCYYQKRMEEEKIKRSKYVESRRKSALSPKSVRKAYAKRMEDIDININVNDSSVLNAEEMKKLWITTWGRVPKVPEQELTEELVGKFGLKKTHDIFKRAMLDGFFKLKTLVESLDENGNIKPKENNGTKQNNGINRNHDYVQPKESKYDYKQRNR